MTEHKLLPPNPSRLIEGLRDTGYDFNMAMADLVDNSVDAGASIIDIHIKMELDGKILVLVADNGCGMDREELENAMTYGSISNKPLSCLGKFGLGLKTASTAFCKKLIVITRSESGDVNKAVWDLVHVVNENKWELLFEDPTDEELALLDEASEKGTGTLVVWDNIDRLMKDYADPAGKYARKAFNKKIDGFRRHAGMIYQRSLDPADTRARNIVMKVNGKDIEKWDPFCISEKETELVAKQEVPVELPNGEEAKFAVKAYVIPRREHFSTPEAANKAEVSNEMQGIYIYRENRLIHPADWLGMFRKEPHFTLLRVEFSFDHLLDEAFNVDIKKSRILLNEALYDWLHEFIGPPRNAAEQRYRKGQRKIVKGKADDGHTASDANLKGKELETRMSDVKVIDAKNNEVDVTNKQGTFRIKMPVITPSEDGTVMINIAESIDDGMLWEPCVIDQHHAVRINTGHDYYRKVYIPNLASGVTIQGMDSLLWALCEAELGTFNDSTKKYFSEMRFEVARILRKLVEDLPEPNLEEENDNH